MKLVRFAAIVVLVPLVALAPAHGADAVPSGSYTLVDGPAAGVDVYAGKNGKVSILDRSADARVVAADDDCDQPHLHGTIDGQDEPVGGCGWGRVLLLSKATPTMRATANAITEEERAIASLVKQPPAPVHSELALYAELALKRALEALVEAEKNGGVARVTAAKIRTRLDAAHALDQKLKTHMQANRNPDDAGRQGYVRQLRNALSLKREALDIIEHGESKVADDASAPTPCEAVSASAEGCVVTAFWDVNVPPRVRSALCIATAAGRRTDPQHPLFDGVTQVQRCTVTNRIRRVHGERKRIVRFQVTLTGMLAGAARPLRVTVYWPA